MARSAVDDFVCFKNPPDFIEFFAADGDESFTGAVEAEGLGKAPFSIMLSCQMPISQADALVRTDGFFTDFFATVNIRWILPL